MGDHAEVQLPVREIYLGITSHPGQLSLAIPPRVPAVMICGWGERAVLLSSSSSSSVGVLKWPKYYQYR